MLLIGALVAFWLGNRSALRRRAALAAARGPLRSIVMLRKAPRGVTESMVRTAIVRAIGVEPTIRERSIDDATRGFEAALPGGRTILVLDRDSPYLDDSDAAAVQIADPRFSAAMRDHAAWTSVDLLGSCPDDAEAQRDVLPLLAKVAAALDDRQCLAFLRFDLGSFAPPTDATTEALARGDVGQAFGRTGA